MPKRDTALLLNDIVEAIQSIYQYVERYSFDQFIADKKTVDAVVRNFEIIGEASSLIDEFKL